MRLTAEGLNDEHKERVKGSRNFELLVGMQRSVPDEEAQEHGEEEEVACVGDREHVVLCEDDEKKEEEEREQDKMWMVRRS